MACPPRISGFDYSGGYVYFLTFCAKSRFQVFLERENCEEALIHFRAIAARESFAILAYCLMPDHVHLLVEGRNESADLTSFAKLAKQHSGFAYSQRTGERLWQKGYFDRTLCAEEDVRRVVKYVLENPVRAGLVSFPTEYEFLGSDRWSTRELLDGVI